MVVALGTAGTQKRGVTLGTVGTQWGGVMVALGQRRCSPSAGSFGGGFGDSGDTVVLCDGGVGDSREV